MKRGTEKVPFFFTLMSGVLILSVLLYHTKQHNTMTNTATVPTVGGYSLCEKIVNRNVALASNLETFGWFGECDSSEYKCVVFESDKAIFELKAWLAKRFAEKVYAIHLAEVEEQNRIFWMDFIPE
tara:strand:+ start:2644 stop:3021 length:378 start_codon:yes stop_codon:yes gene_type:complete